MRWFLGAIALLAIGIAFQMGLLVYAMYVLLGVMLVSRYLAREWVENVTAERECSRLTAQIGDKVAVIVNIRNAGKLPIPWLIVEDSVPKDALKQRPPRRVHGGLPELLGVHLAEPLEPGDLDPLLAELADPADQLAEVGR